MHEVKHASQIYAPGKIEQTPITGLMGDILSKFVKIFIDLIHLCVWFYN